MSPKAVGQKIRRLIDARGLTNERVAEMANIDKAYLGRIIRGMVKRPSYATLSVIAKALGVTPGDLTGEKETPKSEELLQLESLMSAMSAAARREVLAFAAFKAQEVPIAGDDHRVAVAV